MVESGNGSVIIVVRLSAVGRGSGGGAGSVRQGPSAACGCRKGFDAFWPTSVSASSSNSTSMLARPGAGAGMPPSNESTSSASGAGAWATDAPCSICSVRAAAMPFSSVARGAAPIWMAASTARRSHTMASAYAPRFHWTAAV